MWQPTRQQHFAWRAGTATDTSHCVKKCVLAAAQNTLKG
jgi:hypothetical protein